MVERGPEKAGVGGSIPSLATIISTTYEPSSQRLRSKTFQLRGGVGLPHVRIARFPAGVRLGMPLPEQLAFMLFLLDVVPVRLVVIFPRSRRHSPPLTAWKANGGAG